MFLFSNMKIENYPMQLPGRFCRTDHIISPLDYGTGNVTNLVHFVQQLTISFEEPSMNEIMTGKKINYSWGENLSCRKHTVNEFMTELMNELISVLRHGDTQRSFSAIRYYQKMVLCHCWRTMPKHNYSRWKKKKGESKSWASWSKEDQGII